ncbi:galactosyltransferase [Flavobacterium faecale]|uniref:Galactosyltransferase n=1 Tax=Flavobacterium faecale TaxID=1355330 RepID=A0A2S1LH14_9FLAO|nr:glycosyltransferase [Flavobacterium faecale]AWG23044.1 galactosyltransferase [Flavobacterium faecale]
MNIALFLEQSFDPDAGGVQRSTSKLAKIFKDEGHNVIVITSNYQSSEIELWNQIPIISIDFKKRKSELKKILEKKQISIIINQAGYSLKLTKNLIHSSNDGIKIINTLRINPLNFYTNYKQFIGLFLNSNKLGFLNNKIVQKIILRYHIIKQRSDLNYIIKNTDAFVMLSKGFTPELYFLAPNLKKYNHKIHSISNPFEKPILNIAQIEKDNIILFVGRLNILQKRVDLLLEIWKKLHKTLPDWKFWVVGEGEDQVFMENYCKENNLNRVTFFGKNNPNEYYKKAKIFHMTSAFEGFGNVLVEAQSYGCVPILFNSYAAAQDIVTHNENGLLVAPFNSDEYVDVTTTLINNPDKLSQMALNGYENVNRFSYDETYKKWEEVFNSLKK